MKALSHIEKLGYKAKDKVTGFEGVITSVDFDLYGCIQYLIQPASKDGTDKSDAKWFDPTRVTITSKKRVMEMPDFDMGYVAEGRKGPAEKPIK